ncbi:MAG TPA: hypothetical protein VNH22_14950 [Blastocatellia bacterium]|jgi:hypothetical protein|nr:hypothetical protein [Blastocatellia bacterium]
MLRKQTRAAALTLLIAVAACGQVLQDSMKGYEMYSWKRDGGWNFALVPGTNRSKTYQEITSGPSVHKGMDAIRAELRRLPKGTVIMWLTDAHPVVDKSSINDSFRLEHPSGKRVRKLKKFCDELGLKLELG